MIVIKENIDTSSAMGKVIFTIMSAISELEASYISERTKEALGILRDNGVRLGNKGLNEGKISEIIDLYENTRLTQQQIAIKCNVSAKTVYNIKKRYNLTKNI